eukprot:Sspe_Gene.12094::Locus_4121_Transcript_1_1_Confidence_1.000_Length_1652::g.12094::m.12094
MQFVVITTAPGNSAKSTRCFCHAPPQCPTRCSCRASSGYPCPGSSSPCVYTLIPVPAVCSRMSPRSCRSCPDTRMHFPATGRVRTVRGVGFPYRPTFASSSSAITFRFTSPARIAAPSSPSTVAPSSRLTAASSSCTPAYTSSLSTPCTIAWCAYAAIPFTPYVTSSIIPNTSSSPTRPDRASTPASRSASSPSPPSVRSVTSVPAGPPSSPCPPAPRYSPRAFSRSRNPSFTNSTNRRRSLFTFVIVANSTSSTYRSTSASRAPASSSRAACGTARSPSPRHRQVLQRRHLRPLPAHPDPVAPLPP